MPQKKKILLVEDDKYICRAYRDGLERAGFDVSIAFDGREALQKVKAENPDLILLDLIMPVRNGFDFLNDINLDKKLKKIPVVILSNLGQESDVKKGLDLGAVDYLIKSNFSMKEVVERVKLCLNKKKGSSQ